LQEEVLIGILEHPMKDFIQTIEMQSNRIQRQNIQHPCIESKYICEGIELYNPLTGVHKMQ
jgi:hypothetical protein